MGRYLCSRKIPTVYMVPTIPNCRGTNRVANFTSRDGRGDEERPWLRTNPASNGFPLRSPGRVRRHAQLKELGAVPASELFF